MKRLACGRKKQKALSIYEVGMKKINLHTLFIIALLVLSLFFLNNILHKGTILDNIHYINDLSFLSFNAKESLKNNELALWTPYFYAGHPLLAIPENYMFDLNFLLIYIFRNIYLAMNLSLVFYLFIAGLGMYFLAYNLTESKKAAFVSAVIYMLNGFMHSFIISGHINILEGYALIPFIFLFVHKALKSRDWIFYSILAGALFALQILSGSMILFFYTALIVGFYFAFNLISRNFVSILVKTLFVGVIIAAVALSLAAIKLLPSFEFTNMSSRSSSVSFEEFLGHPVNLKDIFGTFVTNISFAGISAAIGIFGFILLVFGLFDYRKKLVVFSAFLIMFSLLFASGTFVADLMYRLPGFGKLRHVERALVLFSFAASVLSAYGFTVLSQKLRKFQAYVKYEKAFFALAVFLILLELLLLQNVPTGEKVIAPDEIKLLEFMGNDNSAFRTFNYAQKDIIGAAGYNYYAQKHISEAKGGGGIWINEYVVFLSIAQQELSAKMLGILNVKYLASDKKVSAENFTLVERFNSCKECDVWNAFGPYLYENKKFLPRYYIAPNGMLIVGDNNLARQLVYSMMLQGFTPENSVLVEGTKINDYSQDFLNKFSIIFLLRDSINQESIPKLQSYVSHGGMIVPDILSGQNTVSEEGINAVFNKSAGSYTEMNASLYQNNKIVIDLNGQKGWLVASERFAYFPGWKASIGGKNIEMLKANNAITALHLDGEKGQLVFEYRPSSYARGKLITLAALLAVLGYCGYFGFKKFKKIKSGDSNQSQP